MKTISKRYWASALTCTMLTAGQALADTKTVDMLVLYTPEATQTTEGRDINARIQAFIEYFNRALRNADTDLQARVVHTQVMNWAGNLNRATSQNLSQLTNDSRVNQLRNQYGADIVTLIYRNPANESCGIGWVATGKNGQFYSNAATGGSGYNLSAVNCYIHVVAHESGHNMGLRHSPVQDAQDGYNFQTRHSGTFEYSRGYGVQGTFVTPMAYSSVYGSWNVQPVFSSPRKTCVGLPCGQVNYADAAWALKTMADQIQAYRPTRVGTNPTPTPTPTPAPTVTLFDFEKSITGWTSYYGPVQRVRDSSNNIRLQSYQRTQSYSGTIGNLSGIIQGQKRYRIEADVRVDNNSRNQLISWLYVENNQGQYEWHLVANHLINGRQWIHFTNEVRPSFGQVRRALLYVYGPNAGSNFLLDNVKITQL